MEAPTTVTALPIYVWVLLALTLAALAATALMNSRREQSGMARRAEAKGQLGARVLRRRAMEIRPDLSRKDRRRDLSGTGWRVGRVGASLAGDLWVPYDRTTCVIGPQGSGKTLDLIAPGLLAAPGAALVTLTKPDDLYLTLAARGADDRPVVVLDPFGAAGAVPALVWDPVRGCEDATVAARRAKAFSAGAGSRHSAGDDAARFYAGECAKVLQAYFHAAALAGLTLDDVLRWVADPLSYRDADEILRSDPRAEPLWDGLLRGAIRGDERTASNTITTIQQAMGLFFQSSIRQRCVPSVNRPATDIEAVIRNRGTVYLLGRDDPYASATSLMTAVAEHVLDVAKRLGEQAPTGRLCPPFMACLDELPSTAPIPTLLTRMANERALGLCFVVAAQTWRQLVMAFGEEGGRTLLGLSNNVVVFGGGKDSRFYQEISELIGQRWQTEVRYSARGGWWNPASERSWSKTRRPILEGAEIRRLPSRRALLVAEASAPIRLHLNRCIDGRVGRDLLADQAATRATARQGDGS